MRDVYLILLNSSATSEVSAVINDNWPNSRNKQVSSHAYLVHDPERVTAEISDLIGMNAEGGVLGVVLDLEGVAYTGRNYLALWEWMKKHRRGR